MVLGTPFVFFICWQYCGRNLERLDGHSVSQQCYEFLSQDLQHWKSLFSRLHVLCCGEQDKVRYITPSSISHQPADILPRYCIFYAVYLVFYQTSLTRGWVCRLQLLLVLASAVILGSESRGSHDHILLSQIQDIPTWRARFPYLYSPGIGFPFLRLLRLAGLRRRYSNPHPHGEAELIFYFVPLIAPRHGPP
jgi:hypothetical protein